MCKEKCQTAEALKSIYQSYLQTQITFMQGIEELPMLYDVYNQTLGAVDLMHHFKLITIDEWGDKRSEIFDAIYDNYRRLKDAQIKGVLANHSTVIEEKKTECLKIIENVQTDFDRWAEQFTEQRDALIKAVDTFGK